MAYPYAVPQFNPNSTLLGSMLPQISQIQEIFAMPQRTALQNALTQQQTRGMEINNQYLPSTLQQQLQKLMTENQYLPQSLQADIGYKKGQTAHAYASANLANRNAIAPFTQMGGMLADYNDIVKKFGKDSPQAQVYSLMLQNTIKPQNAVIGYNENGQPIMSPGGIAGSTIGNILSGATGNQGQGNQGSVGNAQPSVTMPPPAVGNLGSAMPGLLPPSVTGNMGGNNIPTPSLGNSGFFMLNPMMGHKSGGAGSTYINPVTQEAIFTPTTRDVSDIQNRTRAIESFLPVLQELKEYGKSRSYSFGAPYFGDEGAKYHGALNKGVDKFVVASNLPKTNEGIATAKKVLERGETESHEAYEKRLDALKNELEAQYESYKQRLKKGYRTSDKADLLVGKGVSTLSDEELLKQLGGK